MLFSTMSNIANDIGSILFPQGCFGCTATLAQGERSLCTVCRNQLPFTEYNFTDENPMDRVFYGKILIKKASSLLFFYENGRIQRLIHHWKYKKQDQIGRFLGDLYGPILAQDSGLPKIDCIIPVPLHPKKKRQRGYNQLTLLGKSLAKHLETLYLENLLKKTANRKTQTHKNRLWRWKNAQNLYTIDKPQLLEHKKILLIDDVVTTGATLEACAKIILQAKGAEIYIVTVAMVP